MTAWRQVGGRLVAVTCQDYTSAMRLLEQRLEEVEAAAAQREAEDLLSVAWAAWINASLRSEDVCSVR